MSDDATQLNIDLGLQVTSQVRCEGFSPSRPTCDVDLQEFGVDCAAGLARRMRIELQNFHLPNCLARCLKKYLQSAYDQFRSLHKRFENDDLDLLRGKCSL